MRDADYDRLFARYRDRGDLVALGRFFDLVSPDLHRLALHLTANANDAVDVVQSTFLIAIEKAERFRGTGSARSWLAGILVNVARTDAARRRGAALPIVDPEAATVPPLDEASARELQCRLRSAVAELPAPYREVVDLELNLDLGAAEIARRLGRNPATVRSQLHRALDLLRRVLPSSWAAFLFATLLSTRAMAAMRIDVLAAGAAAAGASVAAPTAAATTGVLIMNKPIAVVLAAVTTMSLYFLLRFDAQPELEPERLHPVREAADAVSAAPSRVRERAATNEEPLVATRTVAAPTPTPAAAAQRTWQVEFDLAAGRSQMPPEYFRRGVATPIFAPKRSRRWSHALDLFDYDTHPFSAAERIVDGRLLEAARPAESTPYLIFLGADRHGSLLLLDGQNDGRAASPSLLRDFHAQWRVRDARKSKDVSLPDLRVGAFRLDAFEWFDLTRNDGVWTCPVRLPQQGTIFEARYPSGTRVRFLPPERGFVAELADEPKRLGVFVQPVGYGAGNALSGARVVELMETKELRSTVLLREEAGRFELLGGEKAAREIDLLRCDAPGHRPATFDITREFKVALSKLRRSPDDAPIVIRLPMLPTSGFKNRLVTFDRSPIDDARVSLIAREFGPEAFLVGQSDDDGNIDWRCSRPLSPMSRQGRRVDVVARVELASGRESIVGGLSLVELERGDDIRLEASAQSASVRVVERDGSGVGRAFLNVVLHSDDDPRVIAVQPTVRADETGRATLGPYDAKSLTVVVGRDGSCGVEFEIGLDGEASEQILVLDRGGAITGIVVDEDGKPAQARVKAHAHGPSAADRFGLASTAKTRTDAWGRFELEVDADREWTVIADPIESDPRTTTIGFVPQWHSGLRSGATARFEMRRLAQLRFLVRRADGVPIAQAFFHRVGDDVTDDSQRVAARFGFGGRWSPDSRPLTFPFGRSDVVVHAEGCRPAHLSLTVDDGTARTPIEVVLAAGPRVRYTASRSTTESHYFLRLVDVAELGAADSHRLVVNGWQVASFASVGPGLFSTQPLQSGTYDLIGGSGDRKRRIDVRSDVDLGEL